MNDSFLVRALDGLADLNEKLDALLGRKAVLVAKLGDGDALHQFHDEVRPSGVGGAAIEHLGDVGMVHQGQGLALGLEAGHDLFGVHPQLDDFQGHAAADRFLLLGHIDHPHAAFADLLQQLVAANDRAEGFRETSGRLEARLSAISRPVLQENCPRMVRRAAIPLGRASASLPQSSSQEASRARSTPRLCRLERWPENLPLSLVSFVAILFIHACYSE